ncbi:MAG TPA: serine/threonine-protein kinase [Ktedonosporobacter sp.]|nr:serine/threonine-protein kinase [Ktedonosporobacter sp.]
MNTLEYYCPDCGAMNDAAALVCFACGLSMRTTRRLPAQSLSNERFLKQRYRILQQVGKGGFSVVYKAEDTLFNNQRVAVKAVSLSGLSAQEQIEATDAFHREIQVLSGLRFPHLPRIYDHFADSACWYMVMDFIEGITLEKHLEQLGKRGRLPIGEVFDIGLVLCYVLEYLHTRQPAIVFRDLKPANIILTRDGQLCLIDFGIARRFRPGKMKDTLPFGSPGYAAPEQYGRAQTTPRSDIYSLGALLHQLLTGDDPSQTPFHFAPLPVNTQPWWNDLAQLIAQMVEIDSNNRPTNITMVKEALRRLAQSYTWQRELPASAATAYYTPSPSVLLPPLVPPPLPPSPSFSAATGGGQMLVMRQPTAGTTWAKTSVASTNTTWATGGPIPQNTPNWYAVASLVLGILNIFIFPAICSYSNILWYGEPHLFQFIIFVSLLPSLLAVIFGHISAHRARTIYGARWSKGITTAGLVFGYAFGILYLLVCLWLLYGV